jgi:DNA-binding NarL/FixJ family response regulator
MPSNRKPTPSSTHKVRLLIVDDVDRVREELRRWLDLIEEVQVVGEAPDGEAAICQAEALRPEVVLMDLELPGINGWQATREIKSRRLAERIVVLTIHADAESAEAALRAGADVIVPKGTSTQELLAAITGRTYPDPDKE